jgi:predicted ribosome quality control (RQC) complex YloA/Tae2 family protein
MSGQSGDLQQWLNSLKKKAESASSSVGKQEHRPDKKAAPLQHHRYEKEEPAPPKPAAAPGLQDIIQGLAKQFLDIPASGARQQREREDDLKRQEEDIRHRKELAKRKRAELERKKAEAEKAAQQLKAASEAAPKKRTGKIGSHLGLSGNLIRDLRNNPSALREAIMLVEILGPPLADRDPAGRLL